MIGKLLTDYVISEVYFVISQFNETKLSFPHRQTHTCPCSHMKITLTLNIKTTCLLCKSIVIKSSEEIFETSGFTSNGTCILSKKSGYQSFESFEI